MTTKPLKATGTSTPLYPSLPAPLSTELIRMAQHNVTTYARNTDDAAELMRLLGIHPDDQETGK